MTKVVSKVMGANAVSTISFHLLYDAVTGRLSGVVTTLVEQIGASGEHLIGGRDVTDFQQF